MIIDIFYLNMYLFKFRLMKNEFWVDASCNISLFASLWTFYRVYFIQMPQTHCQIINLKKIFMD
jgi:hypothetical protein